MFTRKKTDQPRTQNHNLAQLGLIDIPDKFDHSVDYGENDGDDSDLEAELSAIINDDYERIRRSKPQAEILPAHELDKMIAASLKDVGTDDEDGEDGDDDSDLLNELHNITGNGTTVDEMETTDGSIESEKQNVYVPTSSADSTKIITQRIALYKQAENIAKISGEATKARRFERGLKTLTGLLKQATGGKSINLDDIPPEISIKPMQSLIDGLDKSSDIIKEKIELSTPNSLPLPNSVPATSIVEKDTQEQIAPAATMASKNSVSEEMRSRQHEYKVAALESKKSGDTPMAIQFLKIVKQFDIVIKMYDDGQEVDLSDMPPPPAQFKEFLAEIQATAEPPTSSEKLAEPNRDLILVPTAVPHQTQAIETVKSISMLEALEQRLNKYKAVEESATTEGNSSKARRFGRIVKQYEDALKQYRAGRPVAYEELPVPPGFGRLPNENTATSKSQQPDPVIQSGGSLSLVADLVETDIKTPNSPNKSNAPQELTTRTSGNHQKNNLAEQQMKILLERQKEFKLAAIEAKKAGEIEQAKEYLKIYKGFDALLNAASNGLPVDLNTLPVAPSQRESLEASFAIVDTEECDPNDELSDIGVRIEEQLAKQLMMCKNTRDHHKAMGDVAGTNRFENLALTVQKDLDLVRYSKRKQFPLPKFHYEKRSFNIVHCNTDLTDNELEIVVVRGFNYKVSNPKDVDTYVKVEFPLPNDEIFRTKTTLIKDTDSPDYEQRFKVDIQRGNRQYQRIFKRHGVKFEVFSRGGFLRSDVHIGTVNVKLQPLETKCDIHDTYDLMEGRKPVGGKLEIKLRVRNPILTKQMEHINEKWLVLDA